MFAKIVPVSVYPQEATRLRCLEVLVRSLGASARPLATWALCASSDVRLAQGLVEMPLEVYASWGEDDAVVLQWLATQLNVTILEIDNEEVVDAPPPDPVIPEPVIPEPVPPTDPVTP